MNEPATYVGVDVAKTRLDFDWPAADQPVANTAQALARILQTLPPGTHLVCESTGGYEALLIATAVERGIPISVVPPQRVRHYARSKGKLAKTDRIDARLLTDFGRAHQPAAYQAPEPERMKVRELLRVRTQLIEAQTREASWNEHLSACPLLRRQAQERAQLLEQQIEEIMVEVRQVLANRALAHTTVSRLQQVQGVGELTAWTVWAEMPELGTLEPGQAAGLSGLAPHPRDSATITGRRYIQQGRPQIRRVLYMAAISASRYNPILKTFYQRLRARGKPAKVALIAVARRLIEVLNTLLKNPNFSLAG